LATEFVPELAVAHRVTDGRREVSRIVRPEVKAGDPVMDLLGHPADIAGDDRAAVLCRLLNHQRRVSHQIDGTTTQSASAISDGRSSLVELTLDVTVSLVASSKLLEVVAGIPRLQLEVGTVDGEVDVDFSCCRRFIAFKRTLEPLK